MERSWSIILGIGLVILWIVGLGSANATSWLTWLDGVGALWAFVNAGSIRGASPRTARAGSSIALAVGLFVLWIIAMSSGAPRWQSWWTFAFACAFLLVGIGAGASKPLPKTGARSEPEQTRDRFKKVG